MFEFTSQQGFIMSRNTCLSEHHSFSFFSTASDSLCVQYSQWLRRLVILWSSKWVAIPSAKKVKYDIGGPFYLVLHKKIISTLGFQKKTIPNSAKVANLSGKKNHSNPAFVSSSKHNGSVVCNFRCALARKNFCWFPINFHLLQAHHHIY